MKKTGFIAVVVGVVLGWAMRTDAGVISVCKEPTAGAAAVMHAYVVPGDGFMEVAGRVSRYFPLHMPGHVDIRVYGPDGSLLGASKELLPGIMSQRRGRMDFPFSSRFAFPVPEGATVTARYHQVPAHLIEPRR